ncbi:MAG: hypothetical protein GC182_07345 [Rhodopseudomonas sp.]|nr:hypothetical protein [Rhodopseudomonas sp.]
MTEQRPTPQELAASGGRKRSAPTIDLTATDVTPAGHSEAEQPAAEATAAPTPHDDSSSTSQHKPQQPSDPDSAVIWEPPPESSESASAARDADTAETASGPAAAAGKPPSATSAWVSAALGGVVGAAAIALLLGALWSAGMVTPTGNAGLSEPSGQIAALEKQVADLQKRLSSAGAQGGSAMDALVARVAKLEASGKSAPAVGTSADPALLKRVTDAETAVKTLQAALDALTHRSDEVAARVAQATDDATAAKSAATELRGDLQDVSKTAKSGASSTALDQVQKRIVDLERQVSTTKEELVKVAATAAAPDSAARLAVSAVALRDAVLSGKPYAAELGQAKALGGDDKSLAPLAGFAATGMPSEQSLAQQLSTLLPAMIKAAGAQKPSVGFLERLQANAEHLVSVRRVGAPPGNDAPAVLARVEKAAADNDIAAALAEIGKLPEAARQVAADWVTRAAGRQQAVAAARGFADRAALALGSK